MNRRHELALFWKWASGIPHPGRKSYALIGLRRTGKTALMHKTFNRLFNEQERVLPVHISFVQYLNRAEPITAYEFAEEYLAWVWTKGYPYSIEAILNSDSPAVAQLPDIDRLDEIVLFELTNKGSALWSHYEGEYGKYVRELNGDQTARKILFWITEFTGERILPDVVAEALGLDLLTVRGALEKLYRTDVIERAGITSFSGPTDPLMREFLRYEHYVEVDKLTEHDAEARLLIFRH